MSIRERPGWVIQCDAPGCQVTSDHIDMGEPMVFGSVTDADSEWRAWDGVRLLNGDHLCPEHAVSLCCKCGTGADLILHDDGWRYCADHLPGGDHRG